MVASPENEERLVFRGRSTALPSPPPPQHKSHAHRHMASSDNSDGQGLIISVTDSCLRRQRII
ncbi:hypothetical protein E2C01_069156 [Portunus trituberculatus]|uniref:Uncharacterized protein n=1 Tax=Portunus trituberculatus TaxID=210409 RepID=A0A5B7HPC4_PORTR|nr:hypothetical protein [Portunus trituberculatus]